MDRVVGESTAIQPELPIVMISGHGDLDTAVESIKKGAFDYISKPPDLNHFQPLEMVLIESL